MAQFETDSAAKSAGVLVYDWVLEVDGAAVGHIRGRHYEPWLHYGRSGAGKSELLISFVNSNGERMYYYPEVVLSNVGGDVTYRSLPPDFFTSPKPTNRNSPEDRTKNIARYVIGAGNFDKYSFWELGVQNLWYSYEAGATIQAISDGSPADNSGLKVYDNILEIDGAPLGVFGDRVYEIWRQYLYSKDGKVELLVCFDDPSTGEPRYYYPEIQLKQKSTPI